MIRTTRTTAVVVTLVAMLAGALPAAAETFPQWLQSAWPDAQALGVSRSVFDAATRGLEPDLYAARSRHPRKNRSGAASSRNSCRRRDNICARRRSIASPRGANNSRRNTSDTLARIEQEFGVPGNMVLAIWGRETDYGGEQATVRRDPRAGDAGLYRQAQGFLPQRISPRAEDAAGWRAARRLRSSWGGAMGLTQFLPSEYLQIRGRFRRRRPRRHLSFGARRACVGGKATRWQRLAERRALGDRGARSGKRRLHQGGAERHSAGRRMGERGFVPAYGRKLTATELAAEASLLLPEGTYGPGFLTPKNYYVLKEYNYSDLYVLFVGHLTIASPAAGRSNTPGAKAHSSRAKTSRRCSAASPGSGFTRTSSTARPACSRARRSARIRRRGG